MTAAVFDQPAHGAAGAPSQCASFDLAEEAQCFVAFNWRNYQPMWGLENIEKNDDYEPHHEVEWARRMRELGYDGELFLLFEEGRGGL